MPNHLARLAKKRLAEVHREQQETAQRIEQEANDIANHPAASKPRKTP